MKRLNRIVGFIGLPVAIAVAGCGHTSTIATEPHGAKVFINGNSVCEATPCAYDAKVGMTRRYHLQIQKPGYRDVDLYLDKEMNPLWWLGITVTTGWASYFLSSFAHNLEDTLSFKLEAMPGTAAKVAPAAASPSASPTGPVPAATPATPSEPPAPPPQ